MRVLHILNSASGGATVGTLELMRFSREVNSGIEHFAVYPGLGGDPDHAVSSVCSACCVVPMRWWNLKTGLSPFRRLAVWGREMQLTRFNRRTRHMLRELVREWKIELVHTSTVFINEGAIVAAQLGIPHVWHIRDRVGLDGFVQFALTDRDFVTRISSLSHTIVPMSRFVGEIFVKHGQAEKTRVVYDSVDPALFNTNDARSLGLQLRRSWAVPDGSLLIGKVASVTAPVKRHEIFIRAAGILGRRDPSLRFAVIGPLPKLKTWARRQGIKYFEKLQQLVHEEGIEDRFLWTDRVADVGAMMNAIDILAHACDLEGFGRVAIEAMAAGKPVVGPASGGFTESVVDGETGRLVPVGDPQALAQSIYEIASDPALRERFGRSGRQRTTQMFSPASHLSAMLDIYNSALNGRKPIHREKRSASMQPMGLKGFSHGANTPS